MQIHNVPERHLTQEKGESVGKTLGTVVQVVDPEDNRAGGEDLFLILCFLMDSL